MADDGGHGELFDKGLAMRRAVLGAEYVDRSIQMPTRSPSPFKSSSPNGAGARCGTGRGSTKRPAA